MHAEALQFVLRHGSTDSLRALELGSYDVNGSARPAFPNAVWVGVDSRAGPNVDIVQDVTIPGTIAGSPFDLVLSTEMLEHCSNPEIAIKLAFNSLKPGGTMILTCATDPRIPHTWDGSYPPPGEHYRNLPPSEMAGYLEVLDLDFTIERRAADLYVIAKKCRT